MGVICTLLYTCTLWGHIYGVRGLTHHKISNWNEIGWEVICSHFYITGRHKQPSFGPIDSIRPFSSISRCHLGYKGEYWHWCNQKTVYFYSYIPQIYVWMLCDVLMCGFLMFPFLAWWKREIWGYLWESVTSQWSPLWWQSEAGADQLQATSGHIRKGIHVTPGFN